MSLQKTTTPTLQKRNLNRRAFTLTEILIACLILTVVATFCIINFRSSIQERKRRIAFEQVHRKIELAKLLSNVLHDRIYVVARGSLPVKICLDAGARKKAVKTNALFQQEELQDVSDIIWGQNHSAAGEVRIAFCNGEASLDVGSLSQVIPDVLILKVPDCQDLEIRVVNKDENRAQQLLMSPEEVSRVFPREVFETAEER